MKKLLKNLLQKDRLPCYVLSREPFIFFAYDSDFLQRTEAFAAALAPYAEAHLYMQLGWQHETPNVTEPFIRQVRAALALIPQLRITILANTPREVEALRPLDCRTIFCHQNAFLNERKYAILPGAKKTVDALYIARITPFKRHQLARDIPSLALIGAYSERETEYAQQVLHELAHARHRLSKAAWRIYRAINQAHCGLCLSAEEGAMFVSAEYLLCGIPVVNTPNIGGRDLLLPGFAVKTVDADPASVAAAVRAWVEASPAPEEIRAAFLELCRPHRTTLHNLLNEDFARAHQKNPAIPPTFTGKLPHKLGIRCSLLPHQLWGHTLQ